MYGAKGQLVVSDGSILTAESDEVGIGTNATNPNPTVLVANHSQFYAFARVQVTLLVCSTWRRRVYE